MRAKILFLLMAVLSLQCAMSQNTFQAQVKDEDSGETLIGVSAVVDKTSL